MVTPQTLQDLLTAELYSDEQILWQGHPDPGKHLHLSDLAALPFSILWFGGVLFMFVFMLLQLPRQPMVLITLPFLSLFLAFGFYITIGRFLHKNYQKRHTIYAITNLRVLLIEADRRGFRKRGRQHLLREIRTVTDTISYRSGTATIQFHSDEDYHQLSRVFTTTRPDALGVRFEDIDDYQEARRIYENAKRAAS